MTAQPPPDRRELGFYFALAQIGIEMVMPAVIGVLVDLALGSLPWLTIGGTALGFAGGLTHMVMMLNKHEREQQERRTGPKG
jgi:F0F1-type ATP synthase assembly protein I